MNAKMLLVAMAIGLACIAAKPRAPLDYEDEVSFFNTIEGGESDKVTG